MTITSYSQFTNRYSPRYRLWRTTFAGSTSITESVTTPKFVGQETKIGQKDTDWRLKIAKSQDATGPYTRKCWDHIVPHYTNIRAWTTNGSGDLAEQNMLNMEFSAHNIAGSGNVDNALADRALARLKSKISNQYLHNARMFVPTAELRELRKSIKDAASHTEVALEAIYKALFVAKNVKKLRLPRNLAKQVRAREISERRERTIDYIQSTWLQWSFGMAPLISDIMGALESVDRFLDRPMNKMRVRTSATKEWQGGFKSVSGNQNGWSTDITANAHYTLQYAYVAGLDFDVFSANNYGIAKHLGYDNFGSQVPSLIWELTAFSWVFDYFTTVGAYMNDTFVFPSGFTTYIVRTRKYTCQIDERCDMVESQNQIGWYNHAILDSVIEPGYAKYIELQREKLTSLPRRSIRVKSLDEIGQNAVSKLLNLGALFKVRLW